MKMVERANLIETCQNQVRSIGKQWAEHQDADTRALLDKAYEELDKAKKTPITPEVGMGATGGAGSDCYPYTVVWVSSDGKKLAVTRDEHKPAPGFDYYSNQEYIYTSNMNGPRDEYRLRKNGRWIRQGESMNGGSSISIGHRRYYQDPSF